MQNRVNATTGQRAWYDGQTLRNGSFLSNDVESYWIEVFVTPTAAQREAGRTRNIPIAVPVMASWTKGVTQSAIQEAILRAEAMDPNSIESDNAYVYSLSLDATELALEDSDVPVALDDSHDEDGTAPIAEPESDEPYLLDDEDDDTDYPTGKPASPGRG